LSSSLVVGFFVFPLILIANVIFIFSKDRAAQIVAWISVIIFFVELALFCISLCISVVGGIIAIAIPVFIAILNAIIFASKK
jgi:hypothetical protein